MAEKKKQTKMETQPKGKPKKMKDGTFKWGEKTFKTEKELSDYVMKTTLFIDGKKATKKK